MQHLPYLRTIKGHLRAYMAAQRTNGKNPRQTESAIAFTTQFKSAIAFPTRKKVPTAQRIF
jgi:hypothetical protein